MKETQIEKAKDAEEQTKMVDADGEYLYIPSEVTSFVALEEYRKARDTAKGLEEAAEIFSELSRNIVWSETIDDKEGALRSLVVEFSSYLSASKSKGKTERPENEMVLWKDVNDSWRWLAVYSNNYRDSDNPPEILSKAAHEDFVRAVDAGDWPMPELWCWHAEGTCIGMTDWLSHTDEGFQVSSGYIFPEYSNIAEGVMKSAKGTIRMSHGMPVAEIRRDDKDPSVITRYRSSEISILPAEKAANKMTGFVVLNQQKEVSGMPIPKDKKAWLLDIGATPDQVAAFEGALAAGKDAAEESNLESKEVAKAGDEAPEVKTSDAEVAKEEAPSTEEKQAPQESVTKEMVVDAVLAAIMPLMDVAKELSARLDALEVKAAEEKASEKAQGDVADLTPAASIADMVRSRAIGASEAKVKSGEEFVGPDESADAAKETSVISMFAAGKGVTEYMKSLEARR